MCFDRNVRSVVRQQYSFNAKEREHLVREVMIRFTLQIVIFSILAYI